MSPADVSALAARLPVFPACIHDGRRARISDGYHSAADLAAGRAKRQHRGADVMWRRLTPALKFSPWTSRWHYAPAGAHDRAIVAAGRGLVVLADPKWREHGILCGGAVVVYHGDVPIGGQLRALFTGYHHLQTVTVAQGWPVAAGDPLGVMGGAPVPGTTDPRGLVHLHYDLAHGPVTRLPADQMIRAATPGRAPGGGRWSYVDPAPVLALARHLTPDEAWGQVASVGPAEGPAVG